MLPTYSITTALLSLGKELIRLQLSIAYSGSCSFGSSINLELIRGLSPSSITSTLFYTTDIFKAGSQKSSSDSCM